MNPRRLRVARGTLSLALLAAPFERVGAQAAAVAVPAEWSAWAFGRVGPARTSEFDTHDRRGVLLGSLAGGIGASYGAILGMVRAVDIEDWSFRDSHPPGLQDHAVLGGLRSRGDRLFVVGAAGLARTTRFGGANGLETLAYDLSAHADSRAGGVALTVSGVLGPANIRYLAVSLGAELGWFGFK